MNDFYLELYQVCLEECQQFGRKDSLWERIPNSSLFRRNQFGFSDVEWEEFFSLHFKRYFSEEYPQFDLSVDEVDAFDQRIAKMIEFKMHHWSGWGWSHRIKEAKRILMLFDQSSYSDLQEFLDNGGCSLRGVNTDLLEEALSKKAPTKRKIASCLLDCLQKFDWGGEYFPDSKMIEGTVTSIGYSFDLQIFFGKPFGFSYSLPRVNLDAGQMSIYSNYESVMGLGAGDWDLVDSDSLDESMKVYEETLTRLLYLLTSGLKGAGLS